MKDIIYFWNIYKLTKIYVYTVRHSLKPTFSQNCVYFKNVYVDTLQLFVPSLGYVLHENGNKIDKYIKALSLLLLMFKMSTKIGTNLHVSGFWMLCLVSFKNLRGKLRKLFKICFINFTWIVMLKKCKIISKNNFNKLFLTNQFVLLTTINHSILR